MPWSAAAAPLTVTLSKATFLALYSSTAVPGASSPSPVNTLLSANALSVTEPEAPREICRELAAMPGFG